MTSQLALRLPDDLTKALDALVAEGRYATRTDAVRQAVRDLLDRERRRAIDEALVDGYRRLPPTADEERWADDAGRRMIAEEPW